MNAATPFVSAGSVRIYANNATSRLSVATDAVSAAIFVLPGEGARFPQPIGDGTDFFSVTLEDRRTGQIEICACTARTLDSLTIERAQEGTTAQAFLEGATVSNRMTAEALNGIFSYAYPRPDADELFVNVSGDTMDADALLAWADGNTVEQIVLDLNGGGIGRAYIDAGEF